MQTINKRLELWQKKYQEFKDGGLSRAAYCKKHRIAKSTLNYWFYKIRKLQKNQALIEVKPASVCSPITPLAVVVANRYRIEIPGSFDAQLFAEIVAALEGLR